MIATLLLLAISADSRLVFTKSFPQSQPPFVRITIEQTGAGIYQTAPDDDQPVKFQLTPAETKAVFDAASQVNLDAPIESGLKVANMGQKTIRLEKDGKAAEQTFNYSLDPNAQALTDWFEKISESEQDFLALERAAKYEKIGVNDALLTLQVTWERKRLVAEAQFLPLLDRVTKGESYMKMARDRAAALAATFRTTP